MRSTLIDVKEVCTLEVSRLLTGGASWRRRTGLPGRASRGAGSQGVPQVGGAKSALNFAGAEIGAVVGASRAT